LLKSVTWKLFIVSLPLARLLFSARHCHAFPCAVETAPARNCRPV
jgi:hypothetical protein